jgi:hypothetical protein
MEQVNIHRAKSDLSKLVERAEAGEEIVIARASPWPSSFDRLLIAQSIAEPLTLLTNDRMLERYAGSVRVI